VGISGAPACMPDQVENSRPPRTAHGRRVHSAGVFTGRGNDRASAVLTHGNRIMTDGVETVEAVARVSQRNL
jgi:hypothetical protein